MSPRTREGDGFEISVVFGGQRLSSGGRLPEDVSAGTVRVLLQDALAAVLRQLEAEAAHQKQMAEEELG